jgi:hypothetical protein
MNGTFTEWLLANNGSKQRGFANAISSEKTSYTANRRPQVNLAECLACSVVEIGLFHL